MLYEKLYNSIMESALSRNDKFSLLNTINDKLCDIEDRSFMESVVDNKLEIYEMYNASNITEIQKDELLGLVEEKVINRPLENILKKLEEIRDSKPDSIYDADVKKWVDSNYDDISKASDIILKHKSKDNLSKTENAALIAALVAFCTSPFLTLVPGVGIGLSFATAVISSIVIIVQCVIAGIRQEDYTDSADILTNMKGYINNIDTSKLSEEQKKKVKSISGKIDDTIRKRDNEMKKDQVNATYAIAGAVASR